MGTGTGIIAIFFELIKSTFPKFHPSIFASDILEDSIRCAKKNERRNLIHDRIIYIQSDLFKSFPETLSSKFNVIVFNPPYLPSSPSINETLQKKKIDHSWEGGVKGIETIIDFIKNLGKYLNLNKPHYVYFISSSRSDLDQLKIEINSLGYSYELLDIVHKFFEDIILNRLHYTKD